MIRTYYVLSIDTTRSVADLGYSEGAFCYRIAREARTKNLRPRPLPGKPRPFLIERLLALPVNPSVFDRDLC